MKKQLAILITLSFLMAAVLQAKPLAKKPEFLWFKKDGKSVFLLGANYPFYNGYRGLDLGRYLGEKNIATVAYFNNKDLQKPPITITKGTTGFNPEGLDAQFKDMRDIGIHVLRWFIGNDGRAFLKLDPQGYCLGIDEEALKNMDIAVNIAKKYRIFIAPSLLDFRFIEGDKHLLFADGTTGESHAEIIIDTKKRRQLIENYIQPLAAHFANSDTILYWEIMNEAGNVVVGTDPKTGFTIKGALGRKEASTRSVTPEQMQTFLNEAYDAIKKVDKRHPIMPSGLARTANLPLVVGRVKADLYGAHYNDNGITDFGKVQTVEEIKQWLLNSYHLALDKPLIMTEGAGNMQEHLDYYFNSALNGGWAGYLPWTYYKIAGLNSLVRHSDILTSENRKEKARANIEFLKKFNRDHAQEVNIPEQ